MSIRLIVSLGAFTCLLTTGIAAEQLQWRAPSDKEATVRLNKPEVKTGETFNPEKLGLISRLSKLSGMSVKDEAQRNIGNMEDVLVDLRSGRVLGVLLTHNNRTVLIPGSAFFPVSEGRVVLTDAARKQLDNAPAFDRSSIRGNEYGSALRHFGVQSASSNPVLASQIIGQSIGMDNKTAIGKVQDLVADVPRGELVFVVVNADNEKSKLFAVPPQKFTQKDGGLSMTGDQAHFLAGPTVPANFWTEMALPKFAASVYQHYGLLGKPNTGAGLMPTGRSDEDLRINFLRRLNDMAAMPAARAKDLHVTTDAGKLVLRGTVSSQSAKREILSAAQSAAGPLNVVDELTVK